MPNVSLIVPLFWRVGISENVYFVLSAHKGLFTFVISIFQVQFNSVACRLLPTSYYEFDQQHMVMFTQGD